MGKKRTVRKLRTLKIPESVEKTGEAKARQHTIDETTDAMLDALNSMIEKHDLTFEEALYASDILRLSILAKYINFRIDMKFEEVLEIFSAPDRRAGIA
jgi:hypothetical protein